MDISDPERWGKIRLRGAGYCEDEEGSDVCGESQAGDLSIVTKLLKYTLTDKMGNRSA